ncbi:hypothetical protein [uncultured Friedmanniella sp.]
MYDDETDGCWTCRGTGTVTVEGGTWDERIVDICPVCEGDR